jgi:hypothetical protein
MIGRALLACDNWRVAGIPVSDSLAYFQKELRALERATNEMFGLGLSEAQTPIDLIDGFIGEGYAIPYRLRSNRSRRWRGTRGSFSILHIPPRDSTACWRRSRTEACARARCLCVVHTGGIFG